MQRTTTVNGVVGSRPSCSRTAARSDERSSRLGVPGTALMRRSSWQDRRGRRPTRDILSAAWPPTPTSRSSTPTDSSSAGSVPRTSRRSPRTGRTRTWLATRAGRPTRARRPTTFVAEMAALASGHARRVVPVRGRRRRERCAPRRHARSASTPTTRRARSSGSRSRPRIRGRDTRPRRSRATIDYAFDAGRRDGDRGHRRAQRSVDRVAGADRDDARVDRARARSRANGATITRTSCGVRKAERPDATCACARPRACSRPGSLRSTS